MGSLSSLHQLSDVALLLLRIALGSIFIVHGLGKRRMWKAQPSEQMPVGLLRTLRLLSIAEPAGGLAVLFGFLTQLAALGLALVMLAALRLLSTQVRRPFTTPTGAGWEFEYLLLLVALSLVITGAGKYALDRLLFGI